MNRINVQKAIDVMQRVIDRSDNVCMSFFQGKEDLTKILTTEKELHECGTSACFSGWLAVSPEWKEFSGQINFLNGSAVVSLETAVEKNLLDKSDIKEYFQYFSNIRLADHNRKTLLDTEVSIATFLEIPYRLTCSLIFPYYPNDSGNSLYTKPTAHINAQDVINVLKEIKEGKHI